VKIRVNGDPAPQGSVNAWAVKKGGAYTGQVGMRSASKGHAPWRNAVIEAAGHASRTPGPVWPAGKPVQVEIRFYLRRPKSHYRTGKHAGQLLASAPAWPLTKDLDKLARTVLDGLQGAGIYDDDKQVVILTCSRVYADVMPPGADIEVTAAPRGLPVFVMVDRRAEFGTGPALQPDEQAAPFTSYLGDKS
jgi:crossover junction endodeoxyribonuclease RusA